MNSLAIRLLPAILLCAAAYCPTASALPVRDYQTMVGVTRYPDNHAAMAQGPDGSVYVVADDYSTGFIMKWSAAGALAWNKDMDPTSGADWTTGAAADGNGNIYVPVTDYSNSRALIYKYTPQGERAAYVEQPDAGSDYAPMSGGAAFDRARGLLYAAQVYIDTADWKYYAAVFAYNADLQLQASVRMGLGDYGDIGSNVSLDASGNVYLGTYLQDANYAPQYVAAKYSPGLTQELWTSTAPISPYYGRDFYLFNQGPAAGGLAFWSTSQLGSALRRVSPDGVYGAALDVPRGGWGLLATDEAGAVYVKRQSEDYSQTGLVKISTANEYVWGDALLVEPEENSLMQALVGAGSKIYTTGVTCGETDCGVYLARYSQGDSGDTTAPGAVTDLRVTQVSSYSATLAWTASGDDGSSGTASSYDMRYNIGGAIDSDAAFESAIKVSGLVTPAAAGSAEQFVVGGLSAGATYYFALKTADEAGNISALSDSPEGITAAARKYRVKLSTGDWQIVAVSTWSAPMESLVTVFGGSEAVELPLEFSISTFPFGATGQELSKFSQTTDANGLADVLLKLGNIPAEYGVTATCRDCEASASSVTFTCCGKLPNNDFKQSNSIWAKDAYDGICYVSTATSNSRAYNCKETVMPGVVMSSFTIRQKGCAMTAMATTINYYANTYPDLKLSTTTPSDLNVKLKDLNEGGYDINGQVNFKAIEKISANQIEYDGKVEISSTSLPDIRNAVFETVNSSLKQENPVILKLQHVTKRKNKTSFGTHFVLAIGLCKNKYVISDPGNVLQSTLLDPNEIIVLNATTGNTIGPVVGIRRYKKAE